jgi:hypothetical protein
VVLINKPAIGILVGAALGVLDGLTAWFTSEVRPFFADIPVGSCFKRNGDHWRNHWISDATCGHNSGTYTARGPAIDKTGAL